MQLQLKSHFHTLAAAKVYIKRQNVQLPASDLKTKTLKQKPSISYNDSNKSLIFFNQKTIQGAN